MSANLDILKKHREELLLAEIAALLHDVGKCADEFVISQASDRPNGYKYRYKTAQLHRLPELSIKLLGAQVDIRGLIEKGMPEYIRSSEPWIVRILGRCHSAAHVEKEEADQSGKQPQNNTRLSTAFGHEPRVVRGLTALLDNLPFASLQDRSLMVKKTRRAFSKGLSDTRRPTNEVTLWDWSSIVAAMYKAALAGALLGNKPEPDQMRWRLLSVCVDSLTFLGNSIKVADLLGRQALLADCFERVRVLLEETYPLALRVYQDHSTSLYIVPDVEDLLERNTAAGKEKVSLAELIRSEFAHGSIQGQAMMDGEVAPVVRLDQARWRGQTRPRIKIRPEDIPPIGNILSAPLQSQPDPAAVWQWWSETSEGQYEICPVCRLRPKRQQDEVCEQCRNRRQSRLAAWKSDPAKTIWLDEIADQNGRLALLVARFGLDDWLSGDLVQTLLVKAVENDPEACVPKNPSPARLRRIWETCQLFWTETVDGILQSLPARQRWVLWTEQDLPPVGDLPNDTVCDGTLDGRPISVLRQDDHLLTISLLNGEPKGMLTVSWQSGRAKHSETWKIKSAEPASGAFAQYRPVLTLLTSPDQFLALIPASDGLQVAAKIRQQYIRQLGKVQNRLPLFLGLVFFERKTPLMAVIDTARRMLGQVEFTEKTWQVEYVKEDSAKRLIGLVRDGQQLELHVPIKMGDGTEDRWYPYFFVANDVNVTGRTYRFQYNGRWLVHAKCLLEGDQVYITPSRFAYLYLEHTGQRFRFDPHSDVLLLDELPRLMLLWQGIKDNGITDTGLRGVELLLESKGQLWGRDSEEFHHLVQTTLERSKLLKAVTVDDVVTGRFARCLELYLHILKERVQKGGSK